MITIRNVAALAGKVRFVFSPFFESCQALSVLEQPGHHPSQADWVRESLALLSEKELESFTAISQILGSYRMLDEAFDLPAEVFQASGYGEEMKSFLSRACWSEHQLKLSDRTYAKINAFLLTFWQKAMMPYLEARKPAILDTLRRDQELLHQHGEAVYLSSLSPRIRKKGRGGTDLIIEKKMDLEVDAVRLKELRVYASYFSAPFLVVAGDFSTKRVRFLALCRELQRAETPKERTPEAVSALAFALSDSTRLRMLMMSKTPVSQKTLGDMMGLAKSTISRHVSILVEAGALARLEQPDGEPKLVIRRDRLERLSSDTLALLGFG